MHYYNKFLPVIYSHLPREYDFGLNFTMILIIRSVSPKIVAPAPSSTLPPQMTNGLDNEDLAQ
ncbi:hypothetical protein BpHYR1_029615 [Brachionus plicatilis]|uniref:Uncharacterized protein n=1 Tax=Brachionus plicatilis TaxID=10195 RepID=A0A3M7R0Y8_BRAPC|nr:hypothetical protein BpHYR1_029615 [Brachionus plicatilis]